MRLRLLKILSICILPILFFSCTADVSGSGDGEVTITAYDADSWTENGGDSYDDGMGRIVFMAPENPPDMDLTFEVSVFVESIEYSEIVGPGKIVEIANVPVGMIKVLCRALNDDGSIVAMGSAEVRIVPYKTTSIDLILKKMEQPVTTYDILIGSYANGSVTSSRERASAGDQVTLTIKPEDGYELDELSVIGTGDVITINQAEDGKHYWFIMPDDNLFVTATFKRKLYQFHSTVTSAGSTGSAGTGTYVYFGDWPQTRKSADVTITPDSTTVGSFTYYIGDDGNYYALLNSNYYKVEPIKWRVLTTDYGGKKLLLAENILVAQKYHSSSNKYETSDIRSWLNNSFFNTAFTSEGQGKIETTVVYNHKVSTNPHNHNNLWNGGNNDYAGSETNDKIFLLSEEEATNSAYGFADYNESGFGNTRIRKATDYAVDSGVYQPSDSYGGWWWLRSPYYNSPTKARTVNNAGEAEQETSISDTDVGVCPALCISN